MKEADFAFMPGKGPGEWQSIGGQFVLRCPECTNRFSVQAFHLVAEHPDYPTLWMPNCPHRRTGCRWRVNTAVLAGAASERTRLLVEILDRNPPAQD